MPIHDTHMIDMKVEEAPTPIRLALQVVLQPHIVFCMMVTTPGSGIYTVEPRIIEACQFTFATQGNINEEPWQLFHILIFNILEKWFTYPNIMYGGNLCHETSNARDDCLIHFQSSTSNGNSESVHHSTFS